MTAPLSSAPPIPFDNTFARELEGFFVEALPAPARSPRLVAFNRALADELGLDAGALDSEAGARLFAGAEVPAGATPLAQAYAGHQFGGFSPQLGDGRALLLGEVIDTHGRRRDLQLKGSGRTRFSRGGDGLAALGPVLREYLIGEAMHALGIPTTRALAAATTGEPVQRDKTLPGAVLTRVAASHIRVGTFQFFAARGELDKGGKLADHGIARQPPQLVAREDAYPAPPEARRGRPAAPLADYVIARHYPELVAGDDAYLALLEAVRDRQAALIARWMHVGFIHGVMNTDNMTVSGETIDYGPCAFMDRYDPATVFGSIDVHGRYAYGNQPLIAAWNLARLAETMLPLIDSDESRAVERATEAVQGFVPRYEQHWLAGMRAKLGLSTERPEDPDLIQAFLSALQSANVDFPLAFRHLADAAAGRPEPLRALFADASAIDAWRRRWEERLAHEPLAPAQRADALRRVNPAFIPRNHRVEAALEAAVERSDYGPFEELLAIVTRPFDEQPEHASFAQPAPLDAPPYETFCGT